MHSFSRLYQQLDATTKTQAKIDAMVDYFRQVDSRNAAWAVYFLVGNRLSRVVPPRQLRQWAGQQLQIPEWLFQESYQHVGDLAETISLLVPSPAESTRGELADWVEEILRWKALDEPQRTLRLQQQWEQVSGDDAFVFAKLLTGALRVGVSRRLVNRALAQAFELPVDLVAHRLMGQWEPTPAFFDQLVDPNATDRDRSVPYPFCLANPVPDSVTTLGSVQQFAAEWKWDGIRLQLIRRDGQISLWSRGEERIEDRFPEIVQAAQALPDGTVLDGELLAWHDDRPMDFVQLQRRLNRKRVGKKLLQEVPTRMLAFDLLEFAGQDLRSMPLGQRRQRLEELAAEHWGSGDRSAAMDDAAIGCSPLWAPQDWSQLEASRESAREKNAEGVMLKRWDSTYQVGRVRGAWWKWKVAPATIDAVLIYAQRGHGRRASLYSDYTFALWDNDQLVPFAKAYSGLTDAEIRQVDRFVRQHTRERFGPVRSVDPELVMELAFEKIQVSRRHKSGVAVRFPRILRWRKDKTAAQANTLQDLKQLAQWETV